MQLHHTSAQHAEQLTISEGWAPNVERPKLLTVPHSPPKTIDTAVEMHSRGMVIEEGSEGEEVGQKRGLVRGVLSWLPPIFATVAVYVAVMAA